MENSDGLEPISAVVSAIHVAKRETADAYLLAGILIEGAVEVIADAVPPSAQAACGAASVQLMVDRLRDRGVL